MSNSFSRTILERFQFSPLRDLEKNATIGLLRLAHRSSSDQSNVSQRLDEFEKTIISYFRSRNEDNVKRAIPTINMKLAQPELDIRATNVARPTSTTSPYVISFDRNASDQIYDDNSGYVPLQDVPSQYPSRDETSFTLAAIEDDSFFEPSPYESGSFQRLSRYDYPKQPIYYDDGFGNDRLLFPEEISF